MQHIGEFYTGLIGASTLALPAWITDVGQCPHPDLFLLDSSFIKNRIVQLARGKTAASDGSVLEMLAHLEPDILHGLAVLFRTRIIGTDFDETLWDNFYANLIAKIQHPKNIKKFMPITIIPVLQKLY